MTRGMWAVAAGLVAGWSLGATPVGATVLVPMTDENLVAIALEKTDRGITKKVPGECGVGMHAIVADLRARATAARDGVQ